tara:strand:+ start:200 stop:736 length:537 start_codon:yes stop_codon:yes gene_type:complete
MAASVPSILSTVFFNKVQHALTYDSWNKNNVKIMIDIYSEDNVKQWAELLGVTEKLCLVFDVSKFKKKQTRVFWKRRYCSVEEIPGMRTKWWVRHHGQFRTVVMVKKGAVMRAEDPGVEISLCGTSICSYIAKDREEEKIVEESKIVSVVYYLVIKISTRLLREDDPDDLEKMYTGQP